MSKIEFYAGESVEMVVAVTDAAGQPVDLAGCEVAFRVAAEQPLIKRVGQGIELGANSFTVRLAPTETRALLPNGEAAAVYAYEAAIKTAQGAVSRVLGGVLTVRQSEATGDV